MSGRVLAAPAQPGTDKPRGLVVGGHYKLPSGSVVRLDAILRGGQAGCRYLRRSDGSRVTQADEVSFDVTWLQRHGLLNWGG